MAERAHPNEPIFGSEDLVTLFNPDDVDFEFKVGGRGYLIPAGGSKRMLGYMADLAVKHLVDKLMQKDGKEKELPAMESRRLYEEKIIVDAEPIGTEEVVLTIDDKAQRAFERLNPTPTPTMLPEDPEEDDPIPATIADLPSMAEEVREDLKEEVGQEPEVADNYVPDDGE